MGAKVEEVKKRWRNLRDVFRREHKKVMVHKSRDGATTSDWAFYNQMLSMVDIVEPRQLQGNISQAKSGTQEEDEDVHSNNPDEPSYLPIPDSPPRHVSIPTDLSTPPAQPSCEPGISEQLRRARPRSSLKRKRVEQTAEEKYLQIEEEKLKLLADESGQMKRDSHYHFLMSLLPLIQNILVDQQYEFQRDLHTFTIDWKNKNCPLQPSSIREPTVAATASVEPTSPTPTDSFFTNFRDFYGSFVSELEDTQMS